MNNTIPTPIERSLNGDASADGMASLRAEIQALRAELNAVKSSFSVAAAPVEAVAEVVAEAAPAEVAPVPNPQSQDLAELEATMEWLRARIASLKTTVPA